MATYLQGVTDYIPQIQPFRPDYNFYSSTLQFKQSKHDAARQQMSSLYGSLLNAPLTREDNMASRDKFFKTIEGDIKKLSGMDLSLNTNVQAGSQLFSQLTDNKNLVKDMVWTKNLQNQFSKAKGFKNCTDPEECGGAWWEGGEQALQFKAMEFKNASAEDAMKMGNASYVAQQDVMGKAIKLAKDAGLSVTIDQLQGGYITTTKNGPALAGPLSNLFSGTLMQDGKIKEYYKTKAYVDRKSFAYGNKDKYGSIEGAEAAYVTEKTNLLENLYSQLEAETTDRATTAGKIKEQIGDKIKNDGAVPGSSIVDIYNSMGAQEAEYASSSKVYADANGASTVAKNNPQQAAMAGNAIDASMAAYYLGNDINNAAQTLAYKDYEFKMKVDQYSLESVKQKNRMMMEAYKFENQKQMADLKHQYGLKEQQLAALGPGSMMSPSSVNVAGATDKGPDAWGNEDYKGHDKLNAGINMFQEDRTQMVNDLSAPEKQIIGQMFQASKSHASQGNTQAQSDVVDLTTSYLNALVTANPKTGGEYQSTDPEGIDPNIAANKQSAASSSNAQSALARIQAATTLEEKYAIANGVGIDPNQLKGIDADQMYQAAFEKFAKPDINGNEVLRPHLKRVYENTAMLQQDILAKREYLSQMDGAYATMTKDVIDKAKANGKMPKRMTDAFEAYIGDDGYAATEAVFKKKYMAKGYTAAEADEIYRGDKQYKWWEDQDEEGRGSADGFSAVYNVGASIVDGIATTVTGVLDTAIDLVASPFLFLGHNMWTDDKDDWSYGFGNTGFDYDSPTDVANWGAPGYSDEQKPGFGVEGVDGQGNPGLLDEWKRVFSNFADPQGNLGWLNIHGLGNRAVQGVAYDMVDPKYFANPATQGTIGMLKNTMASAEAVYNLGGFQTSIPEMEGGEQSIAVKKILAQAAADMVMDKKSASRLMPSITYSNIAGGSDDWVGMNMKFNQKWLNKYKGSDKNPGVTRPYMDELVTEGITMYVPKAQANNVFTASADKSSLDVLMDYNNEVTIPTYPKYTKDIKIARSEQGYTQSGMYVTGKNEDGSYIWSSFSQDLPYTQDLATLVRDLQKDFLGPLNQQMTQIDAAWMQKYGIKDPANLSLNP
jgi:hypothetical protein